MSLTQQSAQEFSKARQRAFVETWLNIFRGRPNNLLPFDQVKYHLKLRNSASKGLQDIELNKIVGSVGRYRDFTRSFLPKYKFLEQRWRQVDAITHEGPGLPPIEVYQVGDVFFVLDGNHRVSVARMHDVETIEAYVTDYKTSVSIDSQDDLDDILLKAGQMDMYPKYLTLSCHTGSVRNS